jgi:hypothetical protein
MFILMNKNSLILGITAILTIAIASTTINNASAQENENATVVSIFDQRTYKTWQYPIPFVNVDDFKDKLSSLIQTVLYQEDTETAPSSNLNLLQNDIIGNTSETISIAVGEIHEKQTAEPTGWRNWLDKIVEVVEEVGPLIVTVASAVA